MLTIGKDIIFVIFGALYFVLYYFFGYKAGIEIFIKGGEVLSILNGILGFLFAVGVIGILVKVLKYFFDKFLPNNIYLNFVFKIVTLAKYLLGLQVFTYFAILSESIHNFFVKVYSIGIIIVLIISITSLVGNLFKYKIIKNPKLKLEPEAKTLLPFIEKILIVIIWVLGFITIFSNLGYNVNAIIAGAGIGGLAIAFAAQKSIAQVFGAITILLNKPFKVGDSVKINGVTGIIKDIGLSYVEMVETSGYKIMIPNDAIMSTNIENLTIRKNRKTDFVLGVEYNTSTLKLKKGIDNIKNILQKYVDSKTIDSYRVIFNDFGQFSLNIKVLYYSLLKDFGEYEKQKEEINFEIKKTFEKLGIEMAFPTQEVLLKNSIEKKVGQK